jgi:predicted DNA-binding protein (MmcQ/YjbR family)
VRIILIGMPPSPLARVRKICLGFPDAHEVEAWGAPTFRLKNKLFAMYASPDDHHGGGIAAIWIKSTAVNQSLLIGENPRRYFSPPYVGPSGWIGVRLDGRVNWTVLSGLLRDGYDLIGAKMRPARRKASSSRKRR